MNIQERKYTIIEKIMHLDEGQLGRIESILEEDQEINAALDRSLKQVKHGKTKPHSKVREKYEKWL